MRAINIELSSENGRYRLRVRDYIDIKIALYVQQDFWFNTPDERDQKIRSLEDYALARSIEFARVPAS